MRENWGKWCSSLKKTCTELDEILISHSTEEFCASNYFVIISFILILITVVDEIPEVTPQEHNTHNLGITKTGGSINENKRADELTWGVDRSSASCLFNRGCRSTK